MGTASADGRHRLTPTRSARLATGLAPVALALALVGAGVAWVSDSLGGSGNKSADAVGLVSPSAASRSPLPTSTPNGSPSASAAPSQDQPRSEPKTEKPSPSAASSQPNTGTGPGSSKHPAGRLAGRVVALDPGHGPAGGSGVQVPDGRGGTKDCQTSGTATDSGYAEHVFNYDVAMRVKTLLEAQGATVHMTRGNSASEQVCVDKRGTFAQDTGSELMVSIHGDGNSDRSVKGFFAIISSPPLNDAQGQPSQALAEAVLARLRAGGFTQNPAYPGGISRRSDIAGVALSTKPVVMFELGEMRNPDEAALMSSPDGRQRYAEAVAAGIADWLTS
ncbi:MAG: N-acetylmuramoyl-L-alanine amidase [Bifidobacteriaceae bacterium]|jgi:N-acetylmuramoyl-L-alanine amidase|nr:N-acetylmuramoyl-L-alanine amidase [Bifidobacteriaceae bacterium]